MAVTADTRATPTRIADPGSKTVCTSGTPTPAVLPQFPDDRPAPAETCAFALLTPSKSGAVFLRHGLSLVLPLFTDWNAAGAFLVRAKMTRCWILELATTAAVEEFLRSPPGRPGSAEFHVAVDPDDLMNLTGNLFSVRSVLAALADDRR